MTKDYGCDCILSHPLHGGFSICPKRTGSVETHKGRARISLFWGELFMDVSDKTDENKTPSDDVEYITRGNTTFEVVANCVGKISLLDIVKSAIKRAIESGNY